MMHKFLQRARSHSNEKQSTKNKKKNKDGKSHIAGALTPSILPSVAVLQSPNKTNVNEPISEENCGESEEWGTDAPGDDIYSMASDVAKVSLNEPVDEEDVYEVTDIEDVRKTRGRSRAISQNKSFTQSDDGSVYDRVNSLTRDCCAAKPRLPSDSNNDDIYSHLGDEATQDSDQEYNHIAINSDEVNDEMYDSLNGPVKQSVSSRVNKTSVSSYEDVEIPNLRRGSEKSFTSRPCSMKSDISAGEDTYEDVSMTAANFQVNLPTQRRSAEEDSFHDDTYEDVSLFPILKRDAPPPPAARLRQRQPLPERAELKLDLKEPVVSSVSDNSVPASPVILPPTPDASERKHNQRRNILKGAKVKHPSQWFSRPKLKLEKRNSSNKEISELPSHSTEIPGTFATTEPQHVAPSSPLVNQTGMNKPPTRLANSLEDNLLYKSMQQKLKLADANEF